MIINYIDFLFESMTSIELYYSDTFKERLVSISTVTQNEDVKNLCQKLLDVEAESKYKSDVSFIDLTEQNDKISFTPLQRLKRLWDESDRKKYLISTGQLETEPEEFQSWGYYQSTAKRPENLSLSFTKYKQDLGVGRFVSKIFRDVIKSPVPDSTLEKFVNEFKSMHDFEKEGINRLEIVEREDIRKWYLFSNYEQVRGQLGNSCMRYKNSQKFLDIYVDNPEVCKLLVMWSSPEKTKISGRAIVWTTKSGVMIMDRIYTVSDYQQENFLKYAKAKGWESVSTTGKTFEVQLKSWEYDCYPYMDNFMCLNIDSGILSNDEDRWPSEGWYKLRNTDGTYLSDDVVWCEYNSSYLHRDDARWCEHEDEWCSADDAIYLEYKDVYVTPRADTVFSTYLDQTFYSDDCYWSETIQDYTPVEDSIDIQINCDELIDYLPVSFESEIIKVRYKDKFVNSIKLYTIFNPLTSTYHFLDEEEITGQDIFSEIEKGIKDVVVNDNKIINEIIKNKIPNVHEKATMLSKLKDFWIPNFSYIEKQIKYFLINYPTKDKLRNGRLKMMTSSKKRELKIQLLENVELMNKVGLNKKQIDEMILYNENFIYALCYISYYFLEDVIKDKDILKMWYKKHLF